MPADNADINKGHTYAKALKYVFTTVHIYIPSVFAQTGNFDFNSSGSCN